MSDIDEASDALGKALDGAMGHERISGQLPDHYALHVAVRLREKGYAIFPAKGGVSTYRAILADIAAELDVWAKRPAEASPAGLAQSIREWLADPDSFRVLAAIRDSFRASSGETKA